MIRLRHFPSYVAELKSALLNRKLRLFKEFAPGHFAASISKGNSLVINLKGEMGCYLSPTAFAPALTSPFLEAIKKRLSDALVLDLRPYNDDRIIDFRLQGYNEVFHPTVYDLYVELMPGRGNMVLCEGSFRIIASYRGEAGRLLLKGASYLPPERKLSEETDPTAFDLAGYNQEMVDKEAVIFRQKAAELAAPLISLCKRKIKSSEKKVRQLSQDKLEAESHLHDGDKGNFIFMNLDSIDLESGYMDFYGEKVALNKAKSLTENAEAFFKRAKKARATIENADKYIELAKQEGEEAASLLPLLQNADEEAMKELLERYSILERKGKGKKERLSPALYPYKAEIGGTAYLFGHNAASNDFLSFVYDTRKTHYWLHVKDTHGAHLLIQADNPTDEQIQYGCELALLASNKEEGEVIYCPRGNIRKGKEKGQVVLGEYQSAMIRKISPEAREAYGKREKAK